MCCEQWYEYFLFATSLAHMGCITFQSGTSDYGPNFFVRHPSRRIVDGIEIAMLILYTCACRPAAMYSEPIAV